MMKSNIDRIMAEKGVTTREMGNSTKLSEVTILKARREINTSTLTTLSKIADFLEVNIKDLFEDEKTTAKIQDTTDLIIEQVWSAITDRLKEEAKVIRTKEQIAKEILEVLNEKISQE